MVEWNGVVIGVDDVLGVDCYGEFCLYWIGVDVIGVDVVFV